jgi:N utilization substance protein B
VTVKAARSGAGGAIERRRARELAVQLLYQREVGGLELDALAATFWDQATEAADVALPPAARAYADQLAAGTAARLPEIDVVIESAGATWRLERMNVVDRIVLRLAVYELRHEPDLPAAVVINEALELARTFSTEDSVRFVNGVLDAVRRRSDG